MVIQTTANLLLLISSLVMTTITMMNPICFKITQAIFLVCLLLHVDVVFGGEVRCIDSERQALLHFKAGLVDDYGILSSWGSEEEKRDCCEWKGVHCSNLTRHIQMLDLHGEYDYDGGIYLESRRFLRGKIHPSLLKLQQLNYLNLSWNDFGDTHIPDFFGSLNNLRYLDLSVSRFGGKIPSQFGSLSHLKYLDLRLNRLEGSIPYQLGNLSKLQYLDLGVNNIAGRIPSQLGNLLKLQYLDVNSNYFQGTIPSQLGNLSSLQQLFLGYNLDLKIDDGNHGGGKWLSNLTSLSHLDLSNTPNLNNSHNWLQMIAKLPKLRDLGLSHCSLSDDFILSLNTSKFNFSASLVIFDLSQNTFMSSMIFQWVSNISSNLVELDLSGNLLEGSTSDDFGTAMISLERLYLYSNRLKGRDLKSFMNICTLRSLVIFNNNLTEDHPSFLHNLSAGCAKYSLQELDLSYNQITGSIPDLSIFPSLKTLDLSYNQLSGKIPEGSILPSQLESLSIQSNSLEGGIPKSFGNICTLNSLDLFNNSLSEELPVIIHHLSGCARYSLQQLHLDRNQINGTLPSLSIFPSLKELYLHENRLNGKVPENIQFPSQLESLLIGSNSLEGVITDSHFGNMTKLKYLELSGNSLTLAFSQNWVPSFQLFHIELRSCKLGPAFPKWLQTQNKFQILDVSNAGISDTVPDWFWAKLVSLDHLLFFNISYNNIIGTIPNLPLRFVESDIIITLASNQFEGSIPPFLRGAGSLDLSRNKFSDFLSFLCANGKVETLYHLDLSNNQLSGQIPDCWSHFKSLVHLDLSHNNLSGKIPTSMGSLLQLQILILRDNNLTKMIPLSLRNCEGLVMLDVGENKLSGPIPSGIWSRLQQLRMLSLRRNHFFQSLPLYLCHLTNIQFLDLSFNNLSGQIPKCFENFTSMAQTTSPSDFYDYEYYTTIGDETSFGIPYDLSAFLMWKGAEQMFKNNKLILKGIDLSSNQLSGKIPAEIENLYGLVSLNLSRNNLTGKIPSKIGRLTSLEFLDLSRNQLFGSIPSSLAKIDRLTMLDLSHNHLSGEIPISTQLQSFNASSYEDNLDLCGKPLQKMCIEEEPSQEPIDKIHEDEDWLFAHAFYMSMAYGFVIGFWGIFGSILVNHTWRHAYFRFLNNLTDKIYVMISVKVVKYRMWLKD